MRINMKQKLLKKDMDEAFKEFIISCKVKNLTPRTLEFYDCSYQGFKEYYKGKFEEVDSHVFDGYILWLKEKGTLNDITINTRIKGLRTILYYFMQQNYILEFKIKLIRAEKKIKETYTQSELEKLLKKPDLKRCDFSEYRDWVIINYLLATGNRVGTLINIKINDLDFDSGYILINNTKNKQQQLIPLSKTLIKILTEYLEYRKGDGEGILFCGIHGEKIRVDSMKQTIAKYNKRRGVNKTSVHLFRHTFAKMWILSGGDLFRLQKLLGHSSLDIVKEYVNMYGGDLQRDFDKFNPLEQLSSAKDRLKMKK